MPLTLDQLRTRVEAEVARFEAAWVCQELARKLGMEAPVEITDTPDAAFVMAEKLAVDGTYLGTSGPGLAVQTTAVIVETLPEDFLTDSLSVPTGPVHRAFSTVAVWQNETPHGLVITELAPGHSARELQKRSSTSLTVGSILAEMQLVAPPRRQ